MIGVNILTKKKGIAREKDFVAGWFGGGWLEGFWDAAKHDGWIC